MKVAIFILISIMLNVFVFLTQAGIDQASLEIGTAGYTIATDSSHIDQFNKGNFVLDDDYKTALPEGNGEVEDGSDGNVFTDSWNKVVTWIKGTWGFRYLVEPLTILPNFVKRIFPGEFAEIGFLIGYLWQISTLVSLLILLKGGEQN